MKRLPVAFADLLFDCVHSSEAECRIWLDAPLPVLEKMVARP